MDARVYRRYRADVAEVWEKVFKILQRDVDVCEAEGEISKGLIEKLDVTCRNLARFSEPPEVDGSLVDLIDEDIEEPPRITATLQTLRIKRAG